VELSIEMKKEDIVGLQIGLGESALGLYMGRQGNSSSKGFCFFKENI
jgi:hypothetical protein